MLKKKILQFRVVLTELWPSEVGTFSADAAGAFSSPFGDFGASNQVPNLQTLYFWVDNLE